MNRDFALSSGTGFASAERAVFDQVGSDYTRICDGELAAPILDAMTGPAALLNRDRQIVFANTAMCTLAGVATREEMLGLRLGEVLGCDLALDRLGGCGTHRDCRSCGAINAVLASLDGRSVGNNASIEVLRCGLELTMHFKIGATPVSGKAHDYVLVVFSEISLR